VTHHVKAGGKETSKNRTDNGQLLSRSAVFICGDTDREPLCPWAPM